MKIRLTESELVSLIRQILKEDELMKGFLSSNEFINCNSVRLTFRNTKNPAESGLTNREARKLRRQVRKEDRQAFNEFSKDKPEVDKDYFIDLRDVYQMYNGLNNNPDYNEIFNTEGKPFNPNLTQNIVNKITMMMESDSPSYWKLFYFRDVFGNKKTTLNDFYTYFKDLGGKEAFEKLLDSNYNSQTYVDRLQTQVETYNNELKKNYPFVKPTTETPYYIVWFNNDPQKPDRKNDGIPKMRYFNNYEEWNLAKQVVATEGNKSASETSNPGGASASISFRYKPKGKATDELFK